MAVKRFAPLQVVSMKEWKISFNTPGIMKGALTAMTTWETRVQSYENFHTGNRAQGKQFNSKIPLSG